MLEIAKPKIAVIGLKGIPAIGGAATVGENIVMQLGNEFNFTVYSIASHTDLIGNYGNNKYYKQIIFKSFFSNKLNSLYYYIISTLHALIFCNYDIVHIHHRDAAFIIPILKLRYKVILTIHGFGTVNLSNKWQHFKKYFDLQEKYFIKYANIITTMSRTDSLIISQKIKKKVIYIPNGINPSISNDKGGKKYILFVAGRIISFKNCDLFLKALIKLDYKEEILIVGDLAEAESYGAEIKLLSKKLEKVNFLGMIKNKSELFNIYKNAKLFIFPSQREAMSMVLLEIASIGIPIIASEIDGNTQIFNNSEVLFFRNNDENDLVEKIKWALDNIEDMENRAELAKNKLLNEYTWDKISKEYKNQYNYLIN
jgi:glycosyltransferase involved in cell wall biosynthesis